ncbi:phosphoribosylamine-glycine ligase [Cordyceps militaris]|uniref:phosphoribosylamine--glycine ligase n=1 Tax=Cordyceps militaris TaxID=73501 RepID=A0A2H4SVG0_CORMI|nr:phosphoribosylamine-glycine ligase [Cordyceps militaris]
MKVLVIGKGGREHALAWRLLQCPSVQHVYVAPGNGGTAALPGVTNLEGIDDYAELAQKAEELNIGLVVPGPDNVIVDGVQAVFEKKNIPCFCPSKAAAELEGSKAYAKAFMSKYSIPTARYEHVHSYTAARDYLEDLNEDIVIKVDGLAAGKGVVLPENRQEAQRDLREMMLENKFGPGQSVIIEERLQGPEISVLTFCDGVSFKSLPPGQDHKRIFDGNRGPNTGGMGVYAPVPFVSEAQMQEIDKTIVKPTLEGMKTEGRTFLGMPFTGIMLTKAGPKVLEYNVRFGDPETQTMMLLIEGDLARLLLACVKGRLADERLELSPGYACNVVLTATGYPGPPRAGDIVTINAESDTQRHTHVFHAGTVLAEGALRTCGGRVFSVAARGMTLEEAVQRAYRGVEAISFNGMFYRRDIASQAL